MQCGPTCLLRRRASTQQRATDLDGRPVSAKRIRARDGEAPSPRGDDESRSEANATTTTWKQGVGGILDQNSERIRVLHVSPTWLPTMEDGFDRSKCLEQLEGTTWPEPRFRSSLVDRCHLLRKKPLRDFDAADLRIMIGQSIGLAFLVPMALELVESNPLLEAEFYPADLLKNLLSLAPDFWSAHSSAKRRFDAVVAALEEIPEEIQAELALYRERAGKR